jgi:hypothetical protein
LSATDSTLRGDDNIVSQLRYWMTGLGVAPAARKQRAKDVEIRVETTGHE